MVIISPNLFLFWNSQSSKMFSHSVSNVWFISFCIEKLDYFPGGYLEQHVQSCLSVIILFI